MAGRAVPIKPVKRVGPLASVSGRDDSTSPMARRLRRQVSWLGRLNILLGLIVIGLGVILVRG